jgi:predicted GNAT family acetyltransferase
MKLEIFRNRHGFHRELSESLISKISSNHYLVQSAWRLTQTGTTPLTQGLGYGLRSGDKLSAAALLVDANTILISKKFPAAALAQIFEENPNLDRAIFCYLEKNQSNFSEKYQIRSSEQLNLRKLQGFRSSSEIKGSPRLARPADLKNLLKWFDAFAHETNQDNSALQGAQEIAEHTIESLVIDGRIYFWQDEETCSMLSHTAIGPAGLRFENIYTPPEFRNRGYAEHLISAVQNIILAQPLRRPIYIINQKAPEPINRFYDRLGFKVVSEMNDVKFSRIATDR